MLKQRGVYVNKGYINESGKIIRRVNQEVDPWTIRYSMHDMETGTLIRAPQQLCKKKELIAWADREATEEEMSRLNLEMEALFKETATAANDTPDHKVDTAESHAITRNDSLLR